MRGLRVGETTLDVEITGGWTTGGGERRTRIHNTGGPPVTVDFMPDVPLGAAYMDVSMPVRSGWARRRCPEGPARRWHLPGCGCPRGRPPSSRSAGRVDWRVAPPRIDLEPGQRSTGLRIIDLESDAREWLLTIEGTAGHEYLVDLFGTAVQAAPLGDGVSVSPAPPTTDAERNGMGGGRFMVAFAAGEGRRTVTLRLAPAGP